MYTPEKISAVTGARLIQAGSALPVESLSIDSRTIANGGVCLFFAIKSEKNDGHRYLREVHEKGVRNFIVTEKRKLPPLPDSNIFLAEDAVEAMQKLAADHREGFDIPVIGITGSNGKTIVKEWLWQLMHADFHIVRSPKSYNSQVGVPLSVWLMRQVDNLGLFEAGISMPGEMEKLEKVIRPTIGIFTNIGTAHEKNFSSEREKIREKLRLFKNCKTVILPADDEKILREWMKTGYPADVVGWSFRKKGNLNLRKTAEGLHCQWKGSEFEVISPYRDEASIENLSCCILTALHLGISPEKIADRAKSLNQVGMRLEMLEGINNTLIINDSYSADLNSLQIALDFLDQQKQHAKKTLIISDIPEAGTDPSELYGRVARLCHDKKISRMIGIGPAISAYSDKFPAESVFFGSTDDFLKTFSAADFTNESILVKGARVFAFERITSLLQKKAHETVLEINLNAIASNFSFFKSRLEGRKIMAMVKAAAYGAGNIEIAKLLEYNRVDYLGVAYTTEGIDLRKAGVSTPIMVMNPDPSHYELLVQYNLEPEIFNFSGLRNLRYIAEKQESGSRIPVHLKIDTGMHRLGFDEKDTDLLAEELLQMPGIRVASVFSHLSSADDPQWDEFTLHQLVVFERVSDKLSRLLPEPFLRHIANTAGAARFPGAGLDMVRLGIGLYGISTVEETRPFLIPAGRLKTHISQLRSIQKGDTVGYSRKHRAIKDETIATIPVGYADGVPRKLGNGRFRVFIGGKLAPIVGNVCMDMCMIDVTGIECNEGDEVIIFGPEKPIERMAEQLETIPYEVLTGISSRVKRVFYQE